jgi:hypothetical protein
MTARDHGKALDELRAGLVGELSVELDYRYLPWHRNQVRRLIAQIRALDAVRGHVEACSRCCEKPCRNVPPGWHGWYGTYLCRACYEFLAPTHYTGRAPRWSTLQFARSM